MVHITKVTGEQEAFNSDKFCSSLKKAGAPQDVAQNICARVEEKITPGISTTKLYREALRYLIKGHVEVAARYSLFRGIAALGPAGFLFEQYVEVILQAHGYQTKRNMFLSGVCIKHEVDIVASKGADHYFLELKYHNQPGIKTHVPTVMYAYARLEDIAAAENKREGGINRHHMWLITNTKFTDTATTYATCKHIKLTGWNYPAGASLEEMIVSKKLYPVTVLPSVTPLLLSVLATKGIILAQDLATYTAKDLMHFGLTDKQAAKVVAEVKDIFQTDSA